MDGPLVFILTFLAWFVPLSIIASGYIRIIYSVKSNLFSPTQDNVISAEVDRARRVRSNANFSRKISMNNTYNYSYVKTIINLFSDKKLLTSNFLSVLFLDFNNHVLLQSTLFSLLCRLFSLICIWYNWSNTCTPD